MVSLKAQVYLNKAQPFLLPFPVAHYGIAGAYLSILSPARWQPSNGKKLPG